MTFILHDLIDLDVKKEGCHRTALKEWNSHHVFIIAGRQNQNRNYRIPSH